MTRYELLWLNDESSAVVARDDETGDILDIGLDLRADICAEVDHTREDT